MKRILNRLIVLPDLNIIDSTFRCKGSKYNMDWELENANYKLQDMITVYETEIAELQKEKKELKQEVLFLKAQLEYKTLGNHETEHDKD